MKTFQGYVKCIEGDPLEIQEYFIITEPLTAKELLRILTTEDDYYVVKHGQYILFANSMKTTAYALPRIPELHMQNDTKLPSGFKTKTKDGDLEFSRTFVSLLLCCILILHSMTVTRAASSGKIAEDGRPVAALENVVFKTGTADLQLDATFAIVTTSDYTEIAYSLGDPRKLTQESTVSIRSLPQGINKEMVSTILLYKHVHTLDQVRQLTGLSVVEEQLHSAIQLSVWRQAALVLKDYQIVETSIKEPLSVA